jgi:hypothetical protein
MRGTKLYMERVCRVIIDFFNVQFYFLSCRKPCKFLISVIISYFVILWSVACLILLYCVVSLPFAAGRLGNISYHPNYKVGLHKGAQHKIENQLQITSSKTSKERKISVSIQYLIYLLILHIFILYAKGFLSKNNFNTICIKQKLFAMKITRIRVRQVLTNSLLE